MKNLQQTQKHQLYVGKEGGTFQTETLRNKKKQKDGGEEWKNWSTQTQEKLIRSPGGKQNPVSSEEFPSFYATNKYVRIHAMHKRVGKKNLDDLLLLARFWSVYTMDTLLSHEATGEDLW